MVFGFGPMLPFAAGTVLGWAASICTFLSGVRRCVSFRTMGGPTSRRMLTMIWMFSAFAGALVWWWAERPRLAVLLLAVLLATIGILDPIAARADEAPPVFARLRPVPMVIPVISLLASPPPVLRPL